MLRVVVLIEFYWTGGMRSNEARSSYIRGKLLFSSSVLGFRSPCRCGAVLYLLFRTCHNKKMQVHIYKYRFMSRPDCFLVEALTSRHLQAVHLRRIFRMICSYLFSHTEQPPLKPLSCWL